VQFNQAQRWSARSAGAGRRSSTDGLASGDLNATANDLLLLPKLHYFLARQTARSLSRRKFPIRHVRRSSLGHRRDGGGFVARHWDSPTVSFRLQNEAANSSGDSFYTVLKSFLSSDTEKDFNTEAQRNREESREIKNYASGANKHFALPNAAARSTLCRLSAAQFERPARHESRSRSTEMSQTKHVTFIVPGRRLRYAKRCASL